MHNIVPNSRTGPLAAALYASTIPPIFTTSTGLLLTTVSALSVY